MYFLCFKIVLSIRTFDYFLSFILFFKYLALLNLSMYTNRLVYQLNMFCGIVYWFFLQIEFISATSLLREINQQFSTITHMKNAYKTKYHTEHEKNVNEEEEEGTEK